MIVEDCVSGFSTVARLRNACFPIVGKVVEILEMAGIEVHQFHTECVARMFEISTGPLPPQLPMHGFIHESVLKLYLL